ncbi:MAG: PepSY domain-containing protein [Alphaproteobacteria bacterium]|nr:PepSY domain-containing protein [Alphaproteobacteria bacterium]
MKTLIAATIAALSLPVLAVADDRVPETVLPPAAVIHQLVADGHDLRKVEYERGRYDALVRTADARLVKMAVDPMTGHVIAASDRAKRTDVQAVPVNAVEAIVAAAGEGHYDVTELEFRDGRYRVQARDDDGKTARVEIDAQTGQIASIKH